MTDEKIQKMIEAKKTSLKSAVRAMCWECMGYWNDGKNDCECFRCPLYNWMPYRSKENEPDFSWAEYSQKKIGKTKEEDVERREFTEEEREAARERLIAARQQIKKD